MAVSRDADDSPVVSVLMPTYQQAAFLPRALRSLLDQRFTDWELVAVVDGSRDNTEQLLREYADERFRSFTSVHNQGLGSALNTATTHARGRYLAYLPSDDVMDADHLSRAVEVLEQDPEVYLAYGGVRWRQAPPGKLIRRFRATPTLRDDIGPGCEANALRDRDDDPDGLALHSGNFLALVQAVHRRDLEEGVRWTERHELVSDSIERDFWTGLLAAGARFGYTGAITTEWSDHPEQHHKILAGRGPHPSDPLAVHNGLSYYRQYYRVPHQQRLNFQPVRSGVPVNEDERFGPLPAPPPPAADGLKILFVGALSYNPERVLAFQERGHRLYGLWSPKPPFFDSTGPFPFGDIRDVFYDEDWRAEVRRIKPDIIYGLLNWQVIPLVREVLDAGFDAPVAFHLKESPTQAVQLGHWPTLRHVLTRSDGRIFISEENRRYLEFGIGSDLPDDRVLILDGDLPRAQWMTEHWTPKLSDVDGEPHTVSMGRVIMEPLAELVAAGIHVHLYGSNFIRSATGWSSSHAQSRYLHLHPTVEAPQWTEELSRYDAGWGHVHTSVNGGEVRRAEWNDLNLPARIGTYAVAGLPLIHRDNTGHAVAVERLAQRYGVGIAYRDPQELHDKLQDERQHRTAHNAMVTARPLFSFDHHADRLIDFFRHLIKER